MKRDSVIRAALMGLGLLILTSCQGAGRSVIGNVDNHAVKENLIQYDVQSVAEGPTGIVAIEEWEELLPEYVASFRRNEEMVQTTYGGTGPQDYLEDYPYLKTIYAGYGFSKHYERAKGHSYALQDVLGTQRPKGGASCLSCKTSQFTEALEEEGSSVHSMDFEEFAAERVEIGMTCADCHAEAPGIVNARRYHILEGAGSLPAEVKLSDREMACVQCHVEYYMSPEENATTLPWTEGLGAEEAYAYYEKEGYYDWVHPDTGAELLKAQHPEAETFYGSIHQQAGLDCATCHMPVNDDSGRMMHEHHWTSPLTTVEDSCLTCHEGDSAEVMIREAENMQKAVTDQTDKIAQKLVAMIEKLSEEVGKGARSEADLDKLRGLQREAQFYWDYVFVENSEGFHNRSKQLGYLRHAEQLIDEAMRIMR